MSNEYFEELEKVTTDSKPIWKIIHGLVAYPAVVISHKLFIYEKLGQKNMSLKEICSFFKMEKRSVEAILAINTSLKFIELKNNYYSLNLKAKQFLDKDWHNIMSELTNNQYRCGIQSLNDLIAHESTSYWGFELLEKYDDILGKWVGQKEEITTSMYDVIYGLAAFPAVIQFYSLGLFELLFNIKKQFNINLSCDQINDFMNRNSSKDLKVDKKITIRLLDICVDLGLLTQTPNNKQYALTPLSEVYIIKSSSNSISGILSMLSENYFASDTIALEYVINTDEAPSYGGGDTFAEHEIDKEKAQAFTRAMHSISMAPALYWPEVVNLHEYKCFLDIAGGSGAHSIGLVKYWKDIHAIVYDLDYVCEVAKENIEQYSLQNKISTHVGDMWKETNLPKEADVHFYSQIMHDWAPDKCIELIEKSFNSLPNGGLIIIHEILFEDDSKSGPFDVAAASIGMLRWTKGGRQYSKKEMEEMLESVGFININIQLTGYNSWNVITGIKP